MSTHPSSASRYVPAPEGGWLLFVSANRLLVVDASTGAARVDALWAAASSSQALASILDTLVEGRVSNAPPFALVGWEKVKGKPVFVVDVIARGSVPVALAVGDATEVISAEGASTWLEKRVTGVSHILVGAAPTGAQWRPIVAGVVAASGWQVSADETSERPVASPESSPRAVPAPEVAPHEVAPPADKFDVPAVILPPVEAVASEPLTGAASGYDHLFGVTVARPLAAAAVSEEVAPAMVIAPPPDEEEEAGKTVRPGDHDGHTILTTDLAALRAGRKKSVAPVAEAAPRATHFLESSEGRREPLNQTLVLGRAPTASRVPGSDLPRLIAVVTPNQELSRNHAEVRVEGGTVVVTDLHSRNGTVVTLPGKPPQKLRAGEPTPVIVGSVIDLGDGAIYVVGEE